MEHKADVENYMHSDEATFRSVFDAYSDLYNKACSNKDYALCQVLRLQISSYIAGEKLAIAIDNELNL
jgi:hypothetical protein